MLVGEATCVGRGHDAELLIVEQHSDIGCANAVVDAMGGTRAAVEAARTAARMGCHARDCSLIMGRGTTGCSTWSIRRLESPQTLPGLSTRWPVARRVT